MKTYQHFDRLDFPEEVQAAITYLLDDNGFPVHSMFSACMRWEVMNEVLEGESSWTLATNILNNYLTQYTSEPVVYIDY